MNQLAQLKVSSDSIAWAVRHLNKFGDTDILPVLPEYFVMSKDITRLSSAYSNLDVNSAFKFNTPKRIAVPKVNNGFRIVSQLSPRDAVFYTALSYDVSKKVDSCRIPKERKISCSYRINITPEGGFFNDDEGYIDFKTSIIEGINNPTTKFVLSIDISDFYNQISLHRVANNLELAGVDSSTSSSIESILDSFNSNHHSRGIPVGPSGSIIFAEAALIDIDDFCVRKGYRFCRYVDDFRLFFSSHVEASRALKDITEILFSNHRLSVNSSKTMILEKQKFIEKEFVNEEELEQQATDEKISELIDLKDLIYDAEPEISKEDLNIAQRHAVDELFARVRSDEPLPLGLARFVLRRARALRTDKLLNGILESFNKFIPVLRDVCYYFDAVEKKNKTGRYLALVKQMRSNEAYGFIPYIQEWCVYSVLKNFIYQEWNDIESLLAEVDNDLKDRSYPLFAVKHNLWHIVRESKEKIDLYPENVKRSIILSSCVLSPDEKKHWLSRFDHGYDPIIKSCALYARDNNALPESI